MTAGGFRTPASLAQLDDCLYVLDSNTRAITMFRRTGFGDTVAEAIAWQEGGDYKKSAALWNEALTQNANYDMAYAGLGKAAYRDGDYKEAHAAVQAGQQHRLVFPRLQGIPQDDSGQVVRARRRGGGGAGDRYPGRRENTDQTENRPLEREEE